MATPIHLLVFVLTAILLQADQDATPKAAQAPLTMGQVLVWMDAGYESLRVAQLVERQGVDFVPTAAFLDSLTALHAKTALLESLKHAKTVHSAAEPAKELAAYSYLLACLQKANSETDAGAEKECSKAETEEPSTARFALGLLAKRRGKSNEALGFFNAAVEAAPTIPDNRNYLGLALAMVHEQEEAVAEYREAMRLDPDYETPVSNLASLFLKQNDFKSAARYARQAIAISNQDPYSHSYLGLALCKLAECSEGLEELRTAVRLDPENPGFHRNLAAVLEFNRDYSGALQEYREVDRLSPDDVHIHKRMLIVLLGLGRKDEAGQECEKVRIMAHQKSCKEVLQHLLAEGGEALEVH